jgi:murein DD-endopeptidase MepM/ murein hydrolase activator NlpD
LRRLKTFAIVLVTALVTCAVTSLFWIVAYSSISDEPAPRTRGSAKRPPPPREVVLGPSGLAIPVQGVAPSALVDTYSEARAGGARVHDAIDIMAPGGTPVLSAAPGRVEKLFFSKGGGGVTAYVRSRDGGWSYYYAHLQDYAPGLAEGQQLRRGDPIGRVGVTGNANPKGPHLHFAIHRMARGDAWHEGRAVNPYPLLAGRQTN